jgi:hypothetical protein
MIGSKDRNPVTAADREARFQGACRLCDTLSKGPLAELRAHEPDRRLFRRERSIAVDEIGKVHRYRGRNRALSNACTTAG